MFLTIKNVYPSVIKNVRFNLLLLHPNEHSQELHYYYLFKVKLDGCIGSCNTLMIYLVEYVFKVMQKNKIYKFLV